MPNTNTLEIRELSFMEYLERYYGYVGTEEEVEKEILFNNRRLVREYFEEEWCLSYKHAQREVITDLQKEYIKDAKEFNFIRSDKIFWWEVY
ncbi:hypothetical protein ACFX4N_24455 [Priestia sp. YIM B13551]|uniref:hypothetical protein n=1 Tax=Priestia sp. YIM B13551 TaxID=3366306 RepID=UPI00366B2293